jgi:hypothetical protein
MPMCQVTAYLAELPEVRNSLGQRYTRQHLCDNFVRRAFSLTQIQSQAESLTYSGRGLG